WTVRAYCVGLRRRIWRGPGVVHSLSGVPGGGMGGTEGGLGVTPGVTPGGTGFPLESTGGGFCPGIPGVPGGFTPGGVFGSFGLAGVLGLFGVPGIWPRSVPQLFSSTPPLHAAVLRATAARVGVTSMEAQRRRN